MGTSSGYLNGLLGGHVITAIRLNQAILSICKVVGLLSDSQALGLVRRQLDQDIPTPTLVGRYGRCLRHDNHVETKTSAYHDQIAIVLQKRVPVEFVCVLCTSLIWW